jgi:hypothetical protein
MLITSASCPSCGAPIAFKLGSSIVVVCEFCNSAVARTDRDVMNLGKVADLLDTRSPLAVGTEGRYEGRPFLLTGRAQIRHASGGVWDEWYATFGDGGTGWLAEAQGRFYMTFPVTVRDARLIPELNQLRPGQAGPLPGLPNRFVVSEIGAARPVAAEGEIPWLLVPNEEYYFADLSGDSGTFATIDYGEQPPLLFVGKEVTLGELGMRASEDTFGAGEKRVGAVRVTCPKCGGPMDLRAPESERATCPNCNALLDVAEGNLRFLKTLEQRVRPLIPLGSRGTFAEGDFVVVGFMTRYVVVERVRYGWEEYLLYSPQLGFRWLVHDTGHWSFVTPVSAGEIFDGDKIANYRGAQYRAFQGANAFVDAVYGEFYWRVETGEMARTNDFVRPPEILSREISGTEINWSHGVYIDRDEVRRIFNLQAVPTPRTVGMAEPNPHRGKLVPWLVLLAIGLVVGVGVMALGPRRQVFRQTFAFEPLTAAGASRVAFTEPMEIAANQNIRVETTAPVSNSWAYVEGDFVEEGSGLVQNFSAPMEYYYGVDGGESWSEGSPSYVTHLSALPAGKYSLRVEAQWDQWQKPMTITVSVKQGVPRILHLGILLGLLAIGPILIALRYLAFEQKRWAESMYTE